MVQKCLSEGVPEEDPSPILGFGYGSVPIRGPWGCVDRECSQVVRYRSSWEQIRVPQQDSWDAYEYVPNDGPECLDACNGYTGPAGDYTTKSPRPSRASLDATRGRRSLPRTAADGGPASAMQVREPRVVAVALSGRVWLKCGLQRWPSDRTRLRLPRRFESNREASSPSTWQRQRGRSASIRATCSRRSEAGSFLDRRQNQAPPGEPECFFRYVQREDDAVGSTLMPYHRVLCFRTRADNKCG